MAHPQPQPPPSAQKSGSVVVGCKENMYKRSPSDDVRGGESESPRFDQGWRRLRGSMQEQFLSVAMSHIISKDVDNEADTVTEC